MISLFLKFINLVSLIETTILVAKASSSMFCDNGQVCKAWNSCLRRLLSAYGFPIIPYGHFPQMIGIYLTWMLLVDMVTGYASVSGLIRKSKCMFIGHLMVLLEFCASLTV